MRDLNTKTLVKVALVAAIYVVLTYAFSFMSYQYIQFRISEVLILLAFIDPLYIPGLVIGCVIANFYSPLGIVDVVVGSLATLIAAILVSKSKKLWQACLWPVLVNGIIIGAEIEILKLLPENISMIQAMLFVAAGEFAVLFFVGYPLFYVLKQKTHIIEQLKISR